MLTLARTEPEMIVTEDQLDADPLLLACANGTLELRTGALRESRPGDLLTRGMRRSNTTHTLALAALVLDQAPEYAEELCNYVEDFDAEADEGERGRGGERT